MSPHQNRLDKNARASAAHISTTHTSANGARPVAAKVMNFDCPSVPSQPKKTTTAHPGSVPSGNGSVCNARALANTEVRHHNKQMAMLSKVASSPARKKRGESKTGMPIATGTSLKKPIEAPQTLSIADRMAKSGISSVPLRLRSVPIPPKPTITKNKPTRPSKSPGVKQLSPTKKTSATRGGTGAPVLSSSKTSPGKNTVTKQGKPSPSKEGHSQSRTVAHASKPPTSSGQTPSLPARNTHQYKNGSEKIFAPSPIVLDVEKRCNRINQPRKSSTPTTSTPNHPSDTAIPTKTGSSKLDSIKRSGGDVNVSSSPADICTGADIPPFMMEMVLISTITLAQIRTSTKVTVLCMVS